MTVRLWEGRGSGDGVFIRYVSKDSELRNYDSALKTVFHVNRIVAKRISMCSYHLFCLSVNETMKCATFRYDQLKWKRDFSKQESPYYRCAFQNTRLLRNELKESF